MTEILQVTADNIPEELREVPQWTAWRPEITASGKISKIPVNVRTGGNAQSNNAATFSSFDDALCHYNRHRNNGIAGINFAFTDSDPYFGLDLDDCRNPETGEISEEATSILQEFNTYCEVSPSGEGVKLYGRGVIPGGKGIDQDGVEIYDRKHFFCVTGERLEDFSDQIEDRQDQLNELVERLNQGRRTTTGAGQEGWQDEVIQGVRSGSRHNEALRLAGRRARKGFTDAEITHFIMAWNENNTPPKGELSDPDSTELRDIISYVRGEDSSEASEDLLEFPDVVRGAAGQFANVYSRLLEVPRSFLIMSYLTCLGSALGDSVTAASELNPQPRLYTVLLGQSADERKSTALLKTTALFKSAIESFPTAWGVSSGEGLQVALRPAVPGQASCLLLCLDEFKSFTSKCAIKGSVLLPATNSLFESNIYETRTKKSSLILDNAFLSILAASTTETYATIFNAKFTDIGFLNRLFICPGTAGRKHSFPPKIPEQDKIRLEERLRKVIRHARCHGELRITHQARELYHRWYMNLERSVHAKRLGTYAMRFMILLAVNEYRNEIDETTVENTIQLMDWQLAVRKRFDPIDSDNAVAGLEEKVRRVLSSGPKTDKEIKQSTNANRVGLWFYSMAIKNLSGSDEIKRNKKTKRWEAID